MNCKNCNQPIEVIHVKEWCPLCVANLIAREETARAEGWSGAWMRWPFHNDGGFGASVSIHEALQDAFHAGWSARGLPGYDEGNNASKRQKLPATIIPRLLQRYEACALRIWKLFNSDPLPLDDLAHFWIERLESILNQNLLAPVLDESACNPVGDIRGLAYEITPDFGAAYQGPPMAERVCGRIDPQSNSTAADEKCFYLKGHDHGHSWEHKDSCLAARNDVDLSVRAFCAYKKGHPGAHSWDTHVAYYGHPLHS